MTRVWVWGLLALALALAAGLATFQYVNGAEDRALDRLETVTVIGTLQTVPAETTLQAAQSAGLVGPVEIPAKYLPENAVTAVTPDNAQLVTPVELAAGQIVMAGDFVPSQGLPEPITIPDGQVAVSVSLSDPARVSSFLSPGAHVAVYATARIDQAGTGSVQTRVLFDRVAVLAVGGLTADGNAPLTPTPGGTGDAVITLALDPEDAQSLVHALQTSQLYLALLGDDAKVPISSPLVTSGQG